ncbi:class I SAM-dependent methyltransferase [Plantactinospora sp. WMMB782]|uniref:class I SAM-dependent methyltransferase n=1 Tax=Plantactinospora sp. WMMB782 TaxID=3404121 RepID=UPI003B9355E0
MTITHKAPEKWSVGDTIAMAALASFGVDYVPWNAYSMRPAALATVVNEMESRQRKSVVEIGAGASTVYLAHAVARNGGRLVSIEHDPVFGEYVRGVIARNGLASVARVEVVPLAPLPAGLLEESQEWELPDRWYDVERVRLACPPRIDTLVVDGPPAFGDLNALCRDPAVPALVDQLAPSYSLFLDDIDRPADEETARRWERRLGITINLIERISLAVGTPDEGLMLTF